MSDLLTSDIYRSARMYYSGTDERWIKPNTYLYSYFSCGLGESEGEIRLLERKNGQGDGGNVNFFKIQVYFRIII